MIKKIQWHDIPNTISGATKKKLREVAVLDPADLCFAVGDGSFAEDGREDLQVSATLAANMIVAYKTDNRTDEAADAHFEADVRTEKGRRKERRQGNPIVWGALSKAKVSILGTDEQPVLVILGDGRQTAKTCVYVTELLERCRKLLNEDPGPEDNGWTANNPGWVRGYVMQRDPIASKFNDNVWHCVFTFSDKIGKPLVAPGYSARMHLTVDYTDDDPGNVRSLERSSMANFRIPSTISGEAMKLRRLVEEYAFQDARNFPDHKYAPRYFLLLAKQYVQNPCAVGGASEPSDAYVSALYDFSFVCPEIRAAVDAVKDPFAGIEAMRKAAKKYFADSEAEVKRGDVAYTFTVNALSEADQIAKRDKPKAERKPRAPKAAAAVDRSSVYKADAEAVQATTAPMSAQEQHEVDAAAAWLSWLSGDKGALDAFPGLRKAAGLGEPASEAWREAYDLVSAWDGKAMFSFREPVTGDEADKQVVKDMIALISDMRDAMPKLPELAKPADRVAWAIDWMNANKGVK